MFFSNFLDSSVVEASTVSNAVTILHEPKERHHEHCWPNLLSISWRLKNVEEARLLQLIARWRLSEDQGAIFFLNDRECVIKGYRLLFKQTLDHRAYIALEFHRLIACNVYWAILEDLWVPLKDVFEFVHIMLNVKVRVNSLLVKFHKVVSL